MPRDLSQEPILPVDDIQGDLLGDLVKKVERLLFFTIDDVEAFRVFARGLHLTSSADVLEKRALIKARKDAGNDTLVPAPGLNVAFSYAGLERLGVVDQNTEKIDVFRAGMAGSGSTLADPPSDEWDVLRPDGTLHGVFVLTGSSAAEIANLVAERLAPTTGQGFTVIHQEVGQVRPHPVEGHEHFGYADGVSQPGLRGRIDDATPLTTQKGPKDTQGVPGQDLLWPGEFVFGYPRQPKKGEDITVPGEVAKPPVDFMRNGAYLVFRRLRQLVPEFDLAVKRAATEISKAAATEPVTPDLLGAQMVGRWKSGAALINAPSKDDPTFDESDPSKVNDFEFNKPDADGVVCPYAAHVRKVYPRDDVTPFATSPAAAEVTTQTHRMLRRGISFGPELTDAEAEQGVSADDQQRGLLFLCFVTSLEDQFEFVQAAWVNNDDFLHPGSGMDPLIGQPIDRDLPFTGAAVSTRDTTQKPRFDFGRFVHMQGGEYFFTPSISAVKGL